MNKNIKFRLFPPNGGELCIIVLVLMIVLVPSISACTLTCYVNDDNSGDYNIDHISDQATINLAIAAVGANASSSDPGTVILNYTLRGLNLVVV